MPIHREFVGHMRPGLPATVDYLVERFRAGNELRLDALRLVVPGRRAGRRLSERLVVTAAEQGWLLAPPDIVTVGRLPEHLYVPQRPFAGDITQQLTWADVLRSSDTDQLRWLAPTPPLPDDHRRWRELGAVLRRQHVELAADGLDFQDVAQRVGKIGGAEEVERWKTLATFQDAYHRNLDSQGLWDLQTARLKAIEFGECRTDREIILIATVDMNLALREMLDQVAEHVTALVIAPPDWEPLFDEHGCLRSEAWQRMQVSLSDHQIQVVDRPRDQAAAVVRTLAAYEGRYAADEITIGVPHETAIPEIQRQLDQADVKSRWGPGDSLRHTSPYQMLSILADYLSQHRFVDLGTVLRHPDIEDYLISLGIAGNWISELDRYHTDHLPLSVPARWLGSVGRTESLRKATEALDTILAPLTNGELPLPDWRLPIVGLLMTVYEKRDFDRTKHADRGQLQCLKKIQSALDEFAAVPYQIAPSLGIVETIQWLLELVARDSVASEVTGAVELLGWLELPLDDAPALVITSLNEGFVPESVNSDLFFPNALRRELGLLDNVRRYARDVYAMLVLLESRQRLDVIVGRRTRDGDPMAPSRLLFATAPLDAARRARRFFSTEEAPLISASELRTITSSENALAIPRPLPLAAPIDSLRITSFRDYLACPYRFYLRHVLNLRSSSDDADELDGALFGSLAHEVLRRFGCGPARDSSEPDEIAAAVNQEVTRCAASWFGESALPAIYVQLEQLRLRLAEFAKHQAAWVQAGWKIEYVESGEGQSAQFEVDGSFTELRGRIDRIDVHQESGRRVILDYKTSDLARPPQKTHQQHGHWVDLQLPLYRHLALAIIPGAECEMGYVQLPRDVQQTRFSLATWTSREIDDADEEARNVIRKIRQEKFWPPTDPPPDFSEEFATICRDGVL